MKTKMINILLGKLPAAVSTSILLTAGHANAEELSGVYRGFWLSISKARKSANP